MYRALVVTAIILHHDIPVTDEAVVKGTSNASQELSTLTTPQPMFYFQSSFDPPPRSTVVADAAAVSDDQDVAFQHRFEHSRHNHPIESSVDPDS